MDQDQPLTIGKYEILSVIGKGGMGVVYLAQDPMMGRRVAIKTVTHNLSADAGMLQRFYGEAEKMGMLRHDNIITVYHLGEHNGFPYIVMEYVEGDPLDLLIAAPTPLPIFDGLRIIEQVCAALAYAHQHEVVHRDVKPANVIVRPDGVAKLLDFGIARQEKTNSDVGITETGGVIGTVPYMAPERLKGARFDGRSDIFSAGILMFQVLTGRLPFIGQDYTLVNQLLNEKHPPLTNFIHDYPSELDHILDRSLAKDPSDRYQTADEMGADLYSIIETLKGEYTLGLLNVARDLASEEDFAGAQNALFRILKMDPKNVSARAMTKELGLRVSLKARIDQANKLQLEADDALRDKKFEVALQLLERAQQLQPDDPQAAAKIRLAKEKKQTSEQIIGYLQQAEQAKRLGDFTGARAIVEKALQLDTNNSRLRAAYQSLVRQAEAAALQAELKSIVQVGRDALARREYQAVLDLANKAAATHPDTPELQELVNAAREGLLQDHRRQLLADIDDHVRSDATEEQSQSTAVLIQHSLSKFPTDASLLRYQAEVEQAIRDHQARYLVEETLRQCAATLKNDPHTALEKVRQALLQLPADDRLIALEARIHAHLSQLTVEEERAHILAQADGFIKSRNFAMVVSLLQECRPPVLTSDISELLAFALEQARKEEKQQLILTTYTESQILLRQEKFRECVALVTPVAQTTRDARLLSILTQAQTTLDRRANDLETALKLLQPFADSNCHEQLLSLIPSLPTYCSTSTEIRAVQDRAETNWKKEQTYLNALGRGYAALDSCHLEMGGTDFDAIHDSSGFSGLQALFSDRRRVYADVALTAQIKQIEAAPAEMRTLLDSATTNMILRFASERTVSQWTLLHQRTEDSSKGRSMWDRFRNSSS